MGNRGLLGSLFDISFTEFITPRIIKILFVLAIIAAGIAALVALIGGIARGGFDGFFMAILSPASFFLYVVAARVWLELIMIIFRIAENTDSLAGRGKTETTGPPQ